MKGAGHGLPGARGSARTFVGPAGILETHQI